MDALSGAFSEDSSDDDDYIQPQRRQQSVAPGVQFDSDDDSDDGENRVENEENETVENDVQEELNVGNLPSVGENEDNEREQENENNEASFGPVGGFRVRQGSDGEEHIEFASDMEDSDEEMPPPPVHEMMGLEPSAQFAISIDILNRVNENIARREEDRYLARLEQRRANPGPSNGTPQMRSLTRRASGRRRKKSPKKKKLPKPKKPKLPVVLGPLYISEHWNGNGNYKEYMKLAAKMKQNRVHINFTNTTDLPSVHDLQSDEASRTNEVASPRSPQPCSSKQALEAEPETTSGFLLSTVQFERCGIAGWEWKTKKDLLEAFPNLQEGVLYVNENQSESFIHLKVYREVSGEQCQEREGPPPKLSKRDSQREIIYVVTQHYFFHVDPVGVPADLFNIRGIGNRKTFCFDFNNFDVSTQTFNFDVILLDTAILDDHDVHNIPYSKNPILQDVFSNFLGVTPPPAPLEEEAHQKEDIEWFYGQIRKYHKQETLPESDIPLQPMTLKPQLRPYQRDAVHWMLYREGCLSHLEAHSSTQYQQRVDLIEEFLSKMYIPVNLVRKEAGETVTAFYNPYTCYLTWKKPEVPKLSTGGILCDEMGLGKTVETLSLILLNKMPVPEELKEYLNELEPEEVAEKDVEAETQEVEASSSEWEDEESDSDSDYQDLESPKKRRKSEKGRSSKKLKKSRRTKQEFQPKLFRRAASPCEFSTAMEEGTAVAPEAPPSRRPARQSAVRARLTTKEALKKIEKDLKIKSGKKKGKSTAPSRGDKYKALKMLYECSLEEYKFSDRATVKPKFHGKFYDTDIEVRECFECICGETEYGCPKSEIVKCGVCGSSQHRKCVGYDFDIHKLFCKLGRAYQCPHCEALEKPFETKSTLIITPHSISHQWIKEIQRHVQAKRLNILFYKGVTAQGYIPPAKLGRYDIVITTYNVLSSELDYVDLPHCNSADGRRFRNPKRFLSIPSPLPCVMWWRVCLDEAQMVEGIGTKMSNMARRIQAVHRWCVTGTPVNKGLQDLFGLFVFLHTYPISYDIWWNALVRDPFLRKDTSLLYELFGQMIWRNGKQDVLDQLGIPPQTQVVNWLNFSPVETHFYTQQLEICSRKIMDKINRLKRRSGDVDMLNMRLSSLDRFTLNGLFAPFLELRQACCHPQIVKGQMISLQKGTLTMEELLDRLVKKAQMQCIDDHRQVVAALNGMAGLHIIKNNFIQAVDKYREVLQSAEKHKEHFKTDTLQMLHTLENLAEMLDCNHAGIAFTLRDSELRTDAEELRKTYMKKYADEVKAAQQAVTQATETTDSSYDCLTNPDWYLEVLKAANRMQKMDGLILSLKQDLLDVTKKNEKQHNSLAKQFHDNYSLRNVLNSAIKDIYDLRSDVLVGLEELQANEASVFVEDAIRCHLRQKSNSYYNESQGEGRCKLCQYHDNFLIYESKVFKHDSKDKITRVGRNYQKRKLLGELAEELSETTQAELLQQETEDLKAATEHVQLINTELRRGTWGDSETEVILKGILRFAKINKLSSDLGENGSTQMKVFEGFKKEFKLMRILWRSIYDQVSALDELSQATTRLVAVQTNEESNITSEGRMPGPSKKLKQLTSGLLEKNLKLQNIHIIAYYEIEPKLEQMGHEYHTGQQQLSLHLGQLLYLKSLKNNGYGKKGTLNTEDCPICAIQLGKEWSVLRCGHSFCSDCVKKMCENPLHRFQCPLCRVDMKLADVSFVDTSENEVACPGTSNGEPGVIVNEIKKHVKGSHSTKVEAVVEKLLQLQETHPGEKVIIFSMWTDVLEIIGHALTQNDIKYCLLNQSGRPFHTNLQKFKDREDLQALLMPLSSGAKGLNIIEATHICLVEPILNLASELQAIGRVHRIGQTKPTFVHRFYVKRTIEEKLYQILKGQDVSSDEEGSLTVMDLQNLVTTTASGSTVHVPS